MKVWLTLLFISQTVLLGCASVTQRRDFLSSTQSQKRLCGNEGESQNAILIKLSDLDFVIQAKSVRGLYMTGFVFAPIIPWEPVGSSGTVIRVYSHNKFSPEIKAEFESWQVESQNIKLNPAKILIEDQSGTIENTTYSQIAELTFARADWGNDFTLWILAGADQQKFKFTSRSKWNYQMMGHEEYDPKCVSR